MQREEQGGFQAECDFQAVWAWNRGGSRKITSVYSTSEENGVVSMGLVFVVIT